MTRRACRLAAGPAAARRAGDRAMFRLWCDLVPRRYAGTVFSPLRGKRPQSIVGRCWNFGQDLSGVALLTFVVLKLARVITWSWWWVLSPMWINGIPVVLALCLLAAVDWIGRRQARTLIDQFLSPDQWQAWIAARESGPDASGGTADSRMDPAQPRRSSCG